MKYFLIEKNMKPNIMNSANTKLVNTVQNHITISRWTISVVDFPNVLFNYVLALTNHV